MFKHAVTCAVIATLGLASVGAAQGATVVATRKGNDVTFQVSGWFRNRAANQLAARIGRRSGVLEVNRTHQGKSIKLEVKTREWFIASDLQTGHARDPADPKVMPRH